MTDGIKPIQTSYAGCFFRSRLEARWAVFFDHLGIPWEYEPQGYETGAGRYLPDFWLPEMRMWAEVKGQFTHADFVRTVGAARELRPPQDGQVMSQLLFLGPVPRPGTAWVHVELQILRELLLWQGAFFCRFGGAWTLKSIGTPCTFGKGAFDSADEDLTAFFRQASLESADEPRLTVDADVDEAYRAARSARFEFGR